MRIALIAGISGPTGRELMTSLLNSRHYKRVVLFTRRDNRKLKNIHLTKVLVDFHDLDNHISEMEGVDDVFCLLGTDYISTHKLEDAERFEFDYPLNLARAAHKAGIRNFYLLNSTKAAKSPASDKDRKRAELEHEIQKLGFENFLIFRVNGISKSVNRENGLYLLRKGLHRLVNTLGLGLLDRIRPTPANLVAFKMLDVALSNPNQQLEFTPRDY